MNLPVAAYIATLNEQCNQAMRLLLLQDAQAHRMLTNITPIACYCCARMPVCACLQAVLHLLNAVMVPATRAALAQGALQGLRNLPGADAWPRAADELLFAAISAALAAGDGLLLRSAASVVARGQNGIQLVRTFLNSPQAADLLRQLQPAVAADVLDVLWLHSGMQVGAGRLRCIMAVVALLVETCAEALG